MPLTDFDHITYHVPDGTLGRPDLLTFFRTIGFEEVPANDEYEHGWKVRWFADTVSLESDRTYVFPRIHLVETDDGEHDALALGHFCVKGPVNVIRTRVAKRQPDWIERDSGSGRIWLRFANLRVEVRP